MSVRNCPKCGKLFHDSFSPICEECKKSEEEIYQKVRNYVKDNPGSNIYKISKATEVSEKKILRYVREGKIELSSNIGIGVQCKKCGTNIYSGNYCKKCINNMNKHILNTIEKEKSIKEETKGPRMYTDKKDR